MKALILRNDPQAAVATAHALTDKGFQILSVDTLAVAHALIRIDTVDLLVMDERVERQLTHAIALSAERKNPYLNTILLTDRAREVTDELYELIPSLYALAGSDTAPELLGQLAQCSASNHDDVASRIAQNQAADLAEQVEEPGLLTLEPADFTIPDDDTEGGAPCYADVAIAPPELAAVGQEATIEDVEDVVTAEIAALFRNHPLPHMLHGDPWPNARVG